MQIGEICQNGGGRNVWSTMEPGLVCKLVERGRFELMVLVGINNKLLHRSRSMNYMQKYTPHFSDTGTMVTLLDTDSSNPVSIPCFSRYILSITNNLWRSKRI